MSAKALLLILLAAALATPQAGIAQTDDRTQESYLRLHYTKHEYQVPMRDGVKLFTAVFVPKGAAEKLPIL
ncbi:MAG: X-Pro dipeptidyl-peptidase, partial [Pirellulales bacterium]|nr:X-Pro dipeptidyl-peptidase [Pirellulales bacterium]